MDVIGTIQLNIPLYLVLLVRKITLVLKNFVYTLIKHLFLEEGLPLNISNIPALILAQTERENDLVKSKHHFRSIFAWITSVPHHGYTLQNASTIRGLPSALFKNQPPNGKQYSSTPYP